MQDLFRQSPGMKATTTQLKLFIILNEKQSKTKSTCPPTLEILNFLEKKQFERRNLLYKLNFSVYNSEAAVVRL